MKFTNTLQLLATMAIVACNGAQASDDTSNVSSGVVVGDVIDINNFANPKYANYQYQTYHSETSSGTESCCDNVVFINVGTAMGVTSYQLLSQKIVEEDPNQSTVAIMIDNNAGFLKIVKTSSVDYIHLTNLISSDITGILPECCLSQPKNGYLLGGHSAGGQAAVDAISELAGPGPHDEEFEFTVAGYLGLSSYDVAKNPTDINVPSMSWDFDMMTCFVGPNHSGIPAYEGSETDNRILYEVHLEGLETASGMHCAFTDDGCFTALVCGLNADQRPWIHQAVGESVNKLFTHVVGQPSFSKSDMELSSTGLPTTLFVNQESPSSQFAEAPHGFQPALA
uniref:Chlorophyllase n=1 Tax=Craspedostauros australis TaxID=1486917 RepID=A0A7R9WMF4_9STRA